MDALIIRLKLAWLIHLHEFPRFVQPSEFYLHLILPTDINEFCQSRPKAFIITASY